MPVSMNRPLLAAVILVALLSADAAGQSTGTTFRESVPNLHAPELYARLLRVRIALLDLPGSAEPASEWEMSYRLYYVSEASFDRVLRTRPNGAWEPSPEDFPGRVLLGEGRFKRGPLSDPRDRTFVSAPAPFRARVSDRDRTKFAHLLLAYSLKISDARLNSTIYKSGIFFNDPFATEGGRDFARSEFYLSFLLTPQGRLNTSILR